MNGAGFYLLPTEETSETRGVFTTPEARDYGFWRIHQEEEVIKLPLPKDLLLFDLEATGTDVSVYDLCQIGAVKVCNRCLRVYDEWESLVRPLSEKVDERAMAVHKIPLATLMKAPPLEEALLAFETWIGPHPKIYLPTSWGAWDIVFLMGTYGKTRRRYPLTGKSLDVKSVVYWEYAKGKNRSPKGGLGRMSELLELPMMEHQHDGLEDARRAAELLRAVWPGLRCKRHRGD